MPMVTSCYRPLSVSIGPIWVKDWQEHSWIGASNIQRRKGSTSAVSVHFTGGESHMVILTFIVIRCTCYDPSRQQAIQKVITCASTTPSRVLFHQMNCF